MLCDVLCTGFFFVFLKECEVVQKSISLKKYGVYYQSLIIIFPL